MRYYAVLMKRKFDPTLRGLYVQHNACAPEGLLRNTNRTKALREIGLPTKQIGRPKECLFI